MAILVAILAPITILRRSESSLSIFGIFDKIPEVLIFFAISDSLSALFRTPEAAPSTRNNLTLKLGDSGSELAGAEKPKRVAHSTHLDRSIRPVLSGSSSRATQASTEKARLERVASTQKKSIGRSLGEQ